MLFDNFTLFAPLIKKIMPGIPQDRAMLSASVSFTTIFAGSKDDPRIRAKEAEASSFLRFAPIDLGKAQYASIHGANEHI